MTNALHSSIASTISADQLVATSIPFVSIQHESPADDNSSANCSACSESLREYEMKMSGIHLLHQCVPITCRV
jgi:hypothetical protein